MDEDFKKWVCLRSGYTWFENPIDGSNDITLERLIKCMWLINDYHNEYSVKMNEQGVEVWIRDKLRIPTTSIKGVWFARGKQLPALQTCLEYIMENE